MSFLPLRETIGSPPRQAVCFHADGSRREWRELTTLAARASACLSSLEGSRWALDIDDPFQFAAALIAAWASGKTAVVAPGSLLNNPDAGLEIDGLLVSAGSARRGLTTVDLRDLSAAGKRRLAVSDDAEIVLYTSGSTGTPKAVRRKLRNMETELAEFEGLWMADAGPCRFHSTVSHRHVYGLLFRLLWPLLTRREFAAFDLAYPEQLRKSDSGPEILVASPALLKRIGHLESGSYAWTRVFSSGGLLSRQAAADSERVLGSCPIEVLGSTETSGVAWRRQSAPDSDDWKALPSVSLRTDPDGFLEVASPFSGADDWLRMGDYASLNSATSFRLLGRGDHIAKIEDKRVSLSAIEQSLIRTPWVDDAAAVALSGSGRQFVGAVLRLSRDGAAELEAVGASAFASALRSRLSTIDSIARPRQFRYVDSIPENAQGKREPRVLAGLFE